MKSAAKDVEQALSLPCRRPELGLSEDLGRSNDLSHSNDLGHSEVARASRRAASVSGPTLARTQSPRWPSLKRPANPPASFIVDLDVYEAFISEPIKHSGSLEKAFRVAHVVAGNLGHVLTHKEMGATALVAEVFKPDGFHPAPEYATWLDSDTAPLDKLEEERQSRTKS